VNRPLFRTIVVVGLLLITSLPGLFFLLFQARQIYVKHEMEEKLEQAGLQLIKLPKSSLVWQEKDDEAIIDGKLFDVKSVHYENEYAFLLGLYDEEETKLKKKIEKLQEQKENDNSFYSKLLGLDYFKENHIPFDFSFTTTKLNHKSQWRFCIRPCYHEHQSPPPKA